MLKLVCLLACLIPLSLKAGDKPPVLVTVGSEKIDALELNAKAAAEERRLQRKLSADEKNALLQSLVNQRLMVSEARDEGLAKKDEVRRSVDDVEREMLSKLVYEDKIGSKAQVSEAEAKKFFDANPGLFELRKASQILVAPKMEDKADTAQKRAERLKAKLDAAPGSFAKLAKQDSDDSATKARGGDLGPLRRGMLLPELEKALFAAKPGSLLGPIKTQYGYHILQLNSVHQQTFAEAKDTIIQQVGAARAVELQKQLLDSLAKKYKVSFAKETP